MNVFSSMPQAGLRGAQWDPERLPAGMATSVHPLVTADGAGVLGTLYRKGGEAVVACIMHPREILASHYLVPELLDGGVAVWVQGSRTPGNDMRLEHELALLDVAAGLVFLQNSGFESIILVGNSGGAGLYAFYAEQAALSGERRFARTPAGRPTGLPEAELPVPSGMIFVAPHPGQGILLMNAIDPSVADEDDPLSVDPELFPFSAANGFRPAPEGAAYAPEFVARYRKAQRDRVARLDERARAMVAARMQARKAVKEGSDDPRTRLRAGWQDLFHVARTDADLRCWDCSLDPTDRKVGSLWGRDPFVTNMNGVGFGRVCTPESWLSTWSGLSSRASVERCAPSVRQPTLIVEYTADPCVFPADLDRVETVLGSADKTRVKIRGTHHGQPIAPGEPSGQRLAGETIRTWLVERFDVKVRGRA